ncbi:hypothetical protein [Staphylococcus capitis]|uniref:hypothetical protein n=1 Tax=Staphylococcus capitis TaxID=29388 RepID=UPI000D1A3D5D|nr:hypothetical protein [Staphylococcus capitis]PTG24784.1 hypothetical protein BU628_10690 [Staphylococcus capitis]PTG31224.1 hypothetical protein BU630_01905 [Staphylococcus capitis]PTG37965.1 hypothetical protein BU624_06235 [Staphylococcus capitis]PTG98082.1 hypothetical protein BU625_07160 [Staphylococcus capitis]PTH04534.1 hypothetical protein BU621_07000 [Staphylococcus capitis]
MKNIEMTKNQKLLAALSYFSILFAPLLFPFCVWIFADKPISKYGKNSLINHITWTIFVWIMKSAFNNAKYAHNGAHAHPDAVFIISLIVGIIFGILALICLIISIVTGVKILNQGKK